MTDKVKSKKQDSEVLTAPISEIEELGRALSPAPDETRKWFKSLEFIVETILRDQNPQHAAFFLDSLSKRLRDAGIKVPATTSTPYFNTIPVADQPPYPGDWRMETRIKSIIRWNAMAMVVKDRKSVV